MNDLLKKLKAARAGGPVVLWDGAVGTQLIARGLAARVPEEWNLERPEVLTAIHLDYLNAGSEVVQTNTFGANRLKLGSAGLADKLIPINRGAVAAAREAVKKAGHGLVAGDLGPTGQMLEPSGSLTPEEAQRAFAEQAKVLAEAGADLISIETMFDLAEAQAAVRGARSVASLPIQASMTFKKTPRGFFTMMGVTPAQAVEGLLAAGADVVGANCNLAMPEMIELIREMKKAAEAPLLAQANAGEPKLAQGKTVYAETAEGFAALGPELRAAGAAAIGACCGSTPAFIAELKKRLG